MGDTQRLVLVAAGFALTVSILGAVEAVMVAGSASLGPWVRRVPESVAVLVVGCLVAIVLSPGLGFQGAVYVLLVASAVALHRVRIPEARRSLTFPRAVVLLALGAISIAAFLVLASALAAPG